MLVKSSKSFAQADPFPRDLSIDMSIDTIVNDR